MQKWGSDGIPGFLVIDASSFTIVAPGRPYKEFIVLKAATIAINNKWYHKQEQKKQNMQRITKRPFKIMEKEVNSSVYPFVYKRNHNLAKAD